MVTACSTYGCSPQPAALMVTARSLQHVRLQPAARTVAARSTYGCSPQHVRLQAFEEELRLAAQISPLHLPLEPGERITAAATFTFHSAAVTDGGRLLLWGDNSHGQLGIEASNKSEVRRGQGDVGSRVGSGKLRGGGGVVGSVTHRPPVVL